MIASPWPLIVGALVTTGAGFAGGYALKTRLADAQIARIEAAHAQEREAQARAAAARLARAQDAQAQAVHALDETRRELDDTQRRLEDAIHTLPAAGCGLSARARGLLNGALDARAGRRLPQGSRRPDRAAAAAAADPGGASERETALWIAGAISRYEECRARIAAIRQWDEVTHGR